jgi:hypothetical protein
MLKFLDDNSSRIRDANLTVASPLYFFFGKRIELKIPKQKKNIYYKLLKKQTLFAGLELLVISGVDVILF